MQTIDSIRRTNELSKVLKKHGFAQDSFEACLKADDIMNAPNSSIVTERQSSADERLIRKIDSLERSKHMLASRVDQLNTDLGEARDYIKQLVQRIDCAETSIRNLKNAGHASTVVAAAAAPAPVAPATPVAQATSAPAAPVAAPVAQPAALAPATPAPATPAPATPAPASPASAPAAQSQYAQPQRAPPAQAQRADAPTQSDVSIENIFYCGNK